MASGPPVDPIYEATKILHSIIADIQPVMTKRSKFFNVQKAENSEASSSVAITEASPSVATTKASQSVASSKASQSVESSKASPSVASGQASPSVASGQACSSVANSKASSTVASRKASASVASSKASSFVETTKARSLDSEPKDININDPDLNSNTLDLKRIQFRKKVSIIPVSPESYFDEFQTEVPTIHENSPDPENVEAESVKRTPKCSGQHSSSLLGPDYVAEEQAKNETQEDQPVARAVENSEASSSVANSKASSSVETPKVRPLASEAKDSGINDPDLNSNTLDLKRIQFRRKVSIIPVTPESFFDEFQEKFKIASNRENTTETVQPKSQTEVPTIDENSLDPENLEAESVKRCSDQHSSSLLGPDYVAEEHAKNETQEDQPVVRAVSPKYGYHYMQEELRKKHQKAAKMERRSPVMESGYNSSAESEQNCLQQEDSKSPNQGASKSPNQGAASKSPNQEASKSPNQEASKNPNQEASKSPNQGAASKSPNQEASKSPNHGASTSAKESSIRPRIPLTTKSGIEKPRLETDVDGQKIGAKPVAEVVGPCRGRKLSAASKFGSLKKGVARMQTSSNDAQAAKVANASLQAKETQSVRSNSVGVTQNPSKSSAIVGSAKSQDESSGRPIARVSSFGLGSKAGSSLFSRLTPATSSSKISSRTPSPSGPEQTTLTRSSSLRVPVRKTKPVEPKNSAANASKPTSAGPAAKPSGSAPMTRNSLTTKQSGPPAYNGSGLETSSLSASGAEQVPVPKATPARAKAKPFLGLSRPKDFIAAAKKRSGPGPTS